jgi:Holliday junction DNA helicase RuvA
MIGQLVGTIAYRAERHIILEVGGVGYKVFVSSETQLALGAITPEPVRLWTYLAVREGALDLYGFLEKSELDFFELLLSVSGIGPKSALAILSLAPPATLEKAIVAGDSSYLTKVSGIGRKSAEKIIVELRDKIGSLASTESSEALQGESETIEALVALGYNLRDAREALHQIDDKLTDTGDKVKAALKILGQRS